MVRTQTFVRSEVTSAKLAPLVEKAVERDVPSWQALVTRVFPGIEEVAGRYRNAGRLAASEDERRDIAVAVIHRLYCRDLDGLKRLKEVCAAGQDSAWPWICRIAQRKAYNHARDHAENLGPEVPGGAPRFARLVELPEEVEELLPASVRVADGIDVHDILAYAESVLSPPQIAALRLHLVGDSDALIAATLALPAAPAAYALWHGAVRRLRYRFNDKGGDGR